MKYISKIVTIAVLMTAASCKNDFEEINAPWDKPNSASTPEMFNAVVSSLPLTAGEQSVMNAWLYPITQQAAITSGSYPFDNAKGALWENYYYTLANVRVLEDRISKSSDAASMTNMSAMLKTIMAYKSFKMTNYFGDMPYKEAGYAALAADKGTGVYKAKYNTQQEIYADILANLKWSIDNFSTGSTQYNLGKYETLFNGDVAMWTKFANSLRLYIAVTVYEKDQALANTHITEALTKPLLSDTDNVGIWPSKLGLSLQWREWSFSANCYLRMGSTMWSMMSASNSKDGSGIFDPRAKIFYEPNNAGEWVAYPQNPTTGTPAEGGTPYDKKRYTAWSDKGTTNLYSPVNLYFEQDLTTIPELILTAAQVHFIKAEVYNRGLGVTANATTAKAEYEAGIKASLNMWKSIAFNSSVWTVAKPASATATATEISNLLTNPAVAYAATAEAGLKQIYAQLWIDQFRQPFDAWTLQRRTGGKTPVSTVNTQYYTGNFGTYNRFVYPDDELSYNAENFKAATGGNNLNSTKLWITK